MPTTPYYQLQQPLLCTHSTCHAASSLFSSRLQNHRRPDGESPFMREQWALAAPGISRPDMEEILTSLSVTPPDHYGYFVRWARESWESLPGNVWVVVLALVSVLVVMPVKAVSKFLGAVDWQRVYVVVGMLVWVWYTSGDGVERVERAPAPRYERAVSYYLVPEVRGWSRQ